MSPCKMFIKAENVFLQCDEDFLHALYGGKQSYPFRESVIQEVKYNRNINQIENINTMN